MRLERFEDKYLLHMQVSAKPMARIGEDLWPRKIEIAGPILAKLRATKSI
jgi:hypothetical protein